MKTLHWDEVGQRLIHQDVTSWAVQWKTKASAMNSSTSWTSHRPCRWQCALVYLTIPGHKRQVELIGNFILNLTETLSQKAWNYRFSSGDCEYSNIRTWYLLPFYQCLHLDLQYKVFLSLFLIHICVLNFLKPKSEEKFIIKERDLASLETWSGLEKKFVGTLKVSNSLHF